MMLAVGLLIIAVLKIVLMSVLGLPIGFYFFLIFSCLVRSSGTLDDFLF